MAFRKLNNLLTVFGKRLVWGGLREGDLSGQRWRGSCCLCLCSPQGLQGSGGQSIEGEEALGELDPGGFLEVRGRERQFGPRVWGRVLAAG